MSVTLTTTPLSTEDILVEWSYSTFDQETIVYKSTDGINWSIVLSPLPAGTNSVVASGLTPATKYYFRIKKTVWVGYTKANGDSNTLWDFGLALDFDGINDKVVIDTSWNDIPMPQNWSASVWVNFLGSGALDQAIWHNRKTGVESQLNWQVNAPNSTGFPGSPPPTDGLNTVTFQFTKGTGSGGLAHVFTTIPIDSLWYNFIVTREFKDATTSVIRLYQNGIEVYSFDVDTDRFATVYGERTEIGTQSDVRWMDGNMDNFSIIHDTITPTEAIEIYSGGLGGTTIRDHPSLFYLADFNTVGAVGGGDNTTPTPLTTISDQSGNGYDGTLTNFALNGATSNYVDSIPSGLDVFSVTPLSTNSITFTVDANPSSLDVEFEYSKLADFSVIDGSGSATTSVAVTGLDAATLYYFRAKNTGMTGYFKIESTTTL